MMSYTIRLIQDEDAEFIVRLRNNPKLNRFLNPTSSNVEEQVKWIENYKSKEARHSEFYFIILENGLKRGLYRLYNINSVSFTIGSWLFESCENNQLPIITDLVISDFGFNRLNKNVLLFDVRKDNHKVIRYHDLKFPKLYNEDELNNYYMLEVEKWESAKNNVLSYLGIDQSTFKTFSELLIF